MAADFVRTPQKDSSSINTALLIGNSVPNQKGRPKLARCQANGCKRIAFERRRCYKHYKELPRLWVREDGARWDYWTLRDRILEIKDPYQKALFTFTYLLGARRSEVVELKPSNIVIEYINAIPHLIIQSNVRKNRKEKTKFFPINTTKEQIYVDVVIDWIKNKPMDAWLFPSPRKKNQHLNPMMVYNWSRKLFGIDIYAHWFRKLRTTHLLNGVQNNDGSWLIPPIPAHVIKRLMGWTDMRPLGAYERYMVSDTARIMMGDKP